MIWRRKAGADPIHRRRGGPPDETPWWDVDDQRFVEVEHVTIADLGRGWRRFPMLNNVEQRDPHGPGSAADALREERRRRRITALDEGRAWRRRATGSLLVARYEMFDGSGDEHRRLWHEHAPEVLAETWRQRWRDRQLHPGWIEARWLHEDDRPLDGSDDLDGIVDWLRIEDHTGGGEDVTPYHHVTLWAGRLHATLTLRTVLGEPIDPAVTGALRALRRAEISRRSDPRSGSA